MARRMNRGPRRAMVWHVTKFEGPMRKHGTWHHENKDPELVLLDQIAHRKIRPMGGFGSGGLVIRKLRAK